MAVVLSDGSLEAVARRPWQLAGFGVTPAAGIATYRGRIQTYAELYRLQPNVRLVVRFLGRNMAQLGLSAFRKIDEDERRARREDPELQPFIDFALSHEPMALKLQEMRERGEIRLVAIHGDTKIENFLFCRNTGDVRSLVDLDTVMPHSWLADWGDMLRSLTNIAGEKERDLSRVRVNREVYDAVTEGFMGATKSATPEEIEKLTGIESRYVVLGHVQRGGVPCAFDRVLSTLLGNHSMNLLREGKVGRMVAWQRGRLTDVDLEEPAGKQRLVPLDHPLLGAARAVGITVASPSASMRASSSVAMASISGTMKSGSSCSTRARRAAASVIGMTCARWATCWPGALA